MRAKRNCCRYSWVCQLSLVRHAAWRTAPRGAAQSRVRVYVVGSVPVEVPALHALRDRCSHKFYINHIRHLYILDQWMQSNLITAYNSYLIKCITRISDRMRTHHALVIMRNNKCMPKVLHWLKKLVYWPVYECLKLVEREIQHIIYEQHCATSDAPTVCKLGEGSTLLSQSSVI